MVRGLQLSLGLSLATSGVKNVWFKVAEVCVSSIMQGAAKTCSDMQFPHDALSLLSTCCCHEYVCVPIV